MLDSWVLIVIALAYVGLLFVIAWAGDKRRIARDHRNIQAVIYSLSLAVYCTSWTFYGAVGSAATTGFGFLPIYLGPALMMFLGFDVLRRVAVTSREQRITSIADFIAYRFGRSHAIAVLVTVAAVIGTVPYVALQLKGISTGIEVIAGDSGSAGWQANLPLWLALSLALFAILFGTRTMDASEHHRGLMWAIAFESVVKLMAFIAIGLFVIYGIFGGLGGVADAVDQNRDLQELFGPWRLPEGFGIQTVLAMAAILCLPRQFHVAVVEFRDPHDLRIARWLFPMYLAVFAFLVVPIAIAGLVQFGGQGVNPDTYVLALPIAADRPLLTLLAFIGGFSAATGMVIVATVALAIMVSNDIVMPLLLRSGLVSDSGRTDLSQTLLRVRRISILAVTLLAYLYYRAIEGGVPLASIGLLSFSAAAQFAPLLLAGIYWRGASRVGALCGLSVGVASWFLLLMLPSLGSQAASWIPTLDFNDGAFVSLALNTATIILASLLFPDREPGTEGASNETTGGLVTLGELEYTIGRFLGMNATREALVTHLETDSFEPAALATPATIQFGERLLAGNIGSASARTVLSTALHHRGLGPEDVMELLDRTSQAVQFNRELLESTLDNMSQGVAVVDSNLNLVGWNRRYLQLMDYPEGLVHLGQPIEQLIRHNAERGLIGTGYREFAVRKRLSHLREGQPYRYERKWLDGKVLEIQGNPMPGGGYVTTYTDISHFKEIESKLQEINETLEQRVRQRTSELSEAVRDVEEAREQAEEANQSKTRFLAAASHDLLQPMNAARLFLSILRQQAGERGDEESRLITRADRSLTAAEELLTALLDISKFDSGMHSVELEDISIEDLFEQLRRRFKGLAANHGLRLRVRPLPCSVRSDRSLLYRILQNFLANAIRYTESGGVLLGCQRRGDQLRISVWDTGVGIEAEERDAIFQEFHRLDYAERLEEKGLGLGLAICDRIAKILDHRIRLTSRPGRGSCFTVDVPLVLDSQRQAAAQATLSRKPSTGLAGSRVLCIDNEADILEGMQMLLERWGCEVVCALDQEQALNTLEDSRLPDLLLADYHLSDHQNGLDVIEAIEQKTGRRIPAIVISADRSDELAEEIRRRGHAYLPKPIKPAALRTLMTNRLAEARSG